MTLEQAKQYLAQRGLQPMETGLGIGAGHRFERSISAVSEWPNREHSRWADVAIAGLWIVGGLASLWFFCWVRG